MAEPQYDPNGLGNGAPDSSEAMGDLPERFQGMSAEQIASAFQEYEQQTQARMQELEPAWQAYQELEPYGGYDALKQAYAQTYTEYQNLLQQVGGQQVNPQQPQNGYQQPQSMGEDWTAEWDYLSPQQQAQRQAQYVLQQIGQVAQNWRDEMRKEVQEQQRQFQAQQERVFDIYRNVLDKQRQNPDLDDRALLKEMLDLQNAPPDRLMDVAARMVAEKNGTAQAEIDRLANERFEQMRETWEQEQRNRELSSMGDGGDAFPFGQFRQGDQNGPPSQQEVERRVMEKALQSGEYNRAHFLP